MTYHRIFNTSNATHLTSLLVISRVGVVHYSVVPVVFRGSFVFLPFFLVIVFSVSLDQGYEKIRLIRSLKKFIFRYQNLVEIYFVSAETIISDAFSNSENV